MIEDLVRGLKSRDAATRWQAASGLTIVSLSGQTKAVSDLGNALDDEHPFVRWLAGVALARSGREQSLAVLKSSLQTGAPRRQAAAADALAYNPRFDPDLLLAALSSRESLVRQSAVETLARHRCQSCVSRFIELLDDESIWVRRAAAGALGHVGDSRVVEPLQDCLNDESPLVRRSAAYGLGAKRASHANPNLVKALDDPDPGVRRNAAWALGRTADRAALPRLQALLSDEAWDGQVAQEAERSIQSVQSPWRRLLPGKRREHVSSPPVDPV